MCKKLATGASFLIATFALALPAWSRPPATPTPTYWGLDAYDTSHLQLGSISIGSTDLQSTGSDFNSNSNEYSDAGGSSPAVGGDQDIILHGQETDFPANSFFDVFVEIQVPNSPLGSMTVDLENESGETQDFGDLGYFISPTYIPLDDLNPTDYPDSSFLSLPPLDEFVNNGQDDSADVILPEPATFGVMAVSTLLLSRRRRRSLDI